MKCAPREITAAFPPRWLLDATGRLETLTERQLAVMELLSQGLCNSDIARQLSCSERTVKQHLSSIFTRLEIYSRLQAGLVAYHSRLGKTEPDWPDSLGQDSLAKPPPWA